jgi:DNA-binding transcriptional LysR family regulator
MELRHLRSFLAVAEELHFGRAAKRLFLVQSALSRQISALERELDVVLLERDRHRVDLTPAGRALLEDVRQLLGQADEATRRARAAGRGTAGTLRLGIRRSGWSWRRCTTSRPSTACATAGSRSPWSGCR